MYQEWVARGSALVARIAETDFLELWLRISSEPAHLAAAAACVLVVLFLSRSLLLALSVACMAAILVATLLGVPLPRDISAGVTGLAALAALVGGWALRRRYRREVARHAAVVLEKAQIQQKLDDEIRWRMAAEATEPRPVPSGAANGTVKDESRPADA